MTDDCTEMPPVLERYDSIEDGRTFSLELTRDAQGVWLPAEQLAMPLHHASSIEWKNADVLASHAGARVKVVATGLGRTSLEQDTRRNTWFATYAARIDRVCK